MYSVIFSDPQITS